MIIKTENNHKIKIDVFNSRNLVLETNPNIVKIISENNVITQLLFGERFFIQIGDFFPVLLKENGVVWYINNISLLNQENHKKIYFKLSCNKLNKTSHWILPLLGNNEEYFKYDDLMLNSYIYCENNFYEAFNKEENLFVKYKFLPNNDDFYEKLTSHPQYIHRNRLHNRYEYLYIFKIPGKYQKDVKLILEGCYSQITDDAKKQILRFHHLKKKGATYNILYKEEEYHNKLKKELNLNFDLPELESKFNKKEETLFKT